MALVCNCSSACASSMYPPENKKAAATEAPDWVGLSPLLVGELAIYVLVTRDRNESKLSPVRDCHEVRNHYCAQNSHLIKYTTTLRACQLL